MYIRQNREQIRVLLEERRSHIHNIPGSVRDLIRLVLVHPVFVLLRGSERVKDSMIVEVDQCTLIEIKGSLHRLKAKAAARYRRSSHELRTR